MSPLALAPAGVAKRPVLPLPMDRRLLIVTAVVGLHLLGLWALHTGLLRRAVALVVPVQVVAEIIEQPQPIITSARPTTSTPTPAPPKPIPPTPPAPRQQPARQPVVSQAPQPLVITAPEPAPQAPAAAPATQPVISTASPATEVAAAPTPPAPAAPPAPPRVDLPSSSADYLNNPPPSYPPLSKRLGEQGRVVVRARIEINGSASQAEVQTSSGFERLDQAALQTVKRWRYLPGKRAGVPEAMWFNIPIQFVLE